MPTAATSLPPTGSGTPAPASGGAASVLLALALAGSVLGEVKVPGLGVGVPNITVSLAAAGLLLGARHGLRETWSRHRRLLLLTATLAAWTLVASLRSVDVPGSLRFWAKWSGFALLFTALVASLRRELPPSAARRVLHGGLLVLALMGLVESAWPGCPVLELVRTDRSLSIFPRVASLMTWPNPYAVVMGCGLFLGRGLRSDGLLSRAGHLGSEILFISQIAQSGSRAGYIAIAVAMIHGAWRRTLPWRWTVAAAAILLAALMVLPVPAYQLGLGRIPGWPAAHGLLAEPYRDLPSLSPAHESVSLRSKIWRAAARVIRDHPLMGLGPNVFPFQVGPAALGPMGHPGLNAHNLALNLLVDAGVPGLLLAVAWGVELFRRGARGDPGTEPAAALLLFGQVLDCFLYDPTFVVVALSVAALVATSPPRAAAAA